MHCSIGALRGSAAPPRRARKIAGPRGTWVAASFEQQASRLDVPALQAVSRNRAGYAVAVLVVIALGLASRRYPDVLAPLFGKYPGDALWAAMVFFGVCVLRPRARTSTLATVAVAACVVIELMKLYQAPWAIAVRHTVVGHLVFGHAFSWQNLVAYALGILAAAGLDAPWLQAASRVAAGRASV